MKSRLFVLIISILLSANSSSYPCRELLLNLYNIRTKKLIDRYDPEKVIDAARKSQEQIIFYASLKGDPTSHAKNTIDAEIAAMDSYIFDNDFDTVLKKWGVLFETVEIATLLIPFYDKVLKASETAATYSSLVSKLKNDGVSEGMIDFIAPKWSLSNNDMGEFRGLIKKDFLKHNMFLGTDFYRFREIVKYFDSVGKSPEYTESHKESMKALQKKLGISNFDVGHRHHLIIGGKKFVSLSEVEQVVGRYPIADLVRLKKIRLMEFIGLAKHAFSQIFLNNKAVSFLLKRKTLNYVRFNRLFKLVYDMNTRNMHFPVINKIVRSVKPIPEKLDELLERSQMGYSDELLASFKRRTDRRTQTVWKEMKEFAKESNDYADAFQRMEKAEVLARQRGAISLTVKKSPFTKLAFLLSGGSGVAAGVHFYVNGDGEIIDLDSSPDTQKGERPLRGQVIPDVVDRFINQNKLVNELIEDEEVDETLDESYRVIKEISDMIDNGVITSEDLSLEEKALIEKYRETKAFSREPSSVKDSKNFFKKIWDYFISLF